MIHEPNAQLKEVVFQLACELSDKRQNALGFLHDLDAMYAEVMYMLEVIGRLSGGEPPKRGEVDPFNGRWARLNNGEPTSHLSPEDLAEYNKAYLRKVYAYEEDEHGEDTE